MALIVAFVGQKGGIGKSTLSRALATSAAQAGLTVRTADLDPQQATITVWAQARERQKLSPSIKVDRFQSAKEALDSVEDEEFFVIDTPCAISDQIADVAAQAVLVVQPTSPTVDDLYPAVLVFHALERMGTPREKLAFALCRTLADEEALEARTYLEGLGYAVLAGDIPERLEYRKAMNQGRAITEADQEELSARAEAMMADLLARARQPLPAAKREIEQQPQPTAAA
jgi:chromosome partitioning protein